MLQRVADLCLDVDAYWEVAETIQYYTSLLDHMYTDKHNKCVKRVALPQQGGGNINEEVYIERFCSIYPKELLWVKKRN